MKLVQEDRIDTVLRLLECAQQDNTKIDYISGYNAGVRQTLVALGMFTFEEIDTRLEQLRSQTNEA